MRKLVFIISAMTIIFLPALGKAQNSDSGSTASVPHNKTIQVSEPVQILLTDHHYRDRSSALPIWSPKLGWYYAYPRRSAAPAFVGALPENCAGQYSERETLYECNGILYRKTYMRGVIVYQIITDQDDLR